MVSEPEKNKFYVLVRGKAQKNLAKIPQPWRARLIEALTVLETDPFVGEKLWGKLADCYKYRIWPYRIEYKVLLKERTVYVFRIKHRQGAYK